MVRTQIQLSEEQSKALKELAAREDKSVAELIRMSVDALLMTKQAVSSQERRRRALAVAGKFRSGDRDLASDHDQYLAEAYNT
jgi:hypothetical protein